MKHTPHPLVEAVRPVADAIGAKLLEPHEMVDGDVPLVWKGTTVGGVRVPEFARDIDWYLSQVEREVGGSLTDLDREEKQRAVKLLNERGAFQLRKSVEHVAEVLGVSRFTVYNYLNRPDDDDTKP